MQARCMGRAARTLYGASRTLQRFDWLHRRRDGVWVLTVVRHPHTICTCSCVVDAYMGLARPEKGTGHVPTFNHREIENLGVLYKLFWGGSWYLFFEIHHDEHGKLCAYLWGFCMARPSV